MPSRPSTFSISANSASASLAPAVSAAAKRCTARSCGSASAGSRPASTASMISSESPRGRDCRLLDHVQFHRQRAGAQPDGEAVGLLDREVAGDLAEPAQDRRLDDRRREDLVVEHDGEGAPDVLLGKLAENAGAARAEAEVDGGPPVEVESSLRIHDVVAPKRRLPVDQ